MATLEEQCRQRGKALVEKFGLKETKTKGTESMHDKMDYSSYGPKKDGGDMR